MDGGGRGLVGNEVEGEEREEDEACGKEDGVREVNTGPEVDADVSCKGLDVHGRCGASYPDEATTCWDEHECAAILVPRWLSVQ